jgi:hypothetical protein
MLEVIRRRGRGTRRIDVEIAGPPEFQALVLRALALLDRSGDGDEFRRRIRRIEPAPAGGLPPGAAGGVYVRERRIVLDPTVLGIEQPAGE